MAESNKATPRYEANAVVRKQAEKAEAAARRSEDIEHAERMHNLAEAFRAQADAPKAEKKARRR